MPCYIDFEIISKFQNYNKSRTLFRLASTRFPHIHIIKLHCKTLNGRLNNKREEHDPENNLGSTFALEESMFYPNNWLAYYRESRKPSLNKNIHLGTNECVDAMCYTQIIIWEIYNIIKS